ncbi:hypothetical protein TNCV_3061511 [Trichonephila clavipes]|nr:hypothetical protein TNCV_3061511 [Trichonephila clavipes]
MGPVSMQGPWIHEIVSIPVHVHQLDSIGNETRQTRQHVSSHQQSYVSVDGPRAIGSLVVRASDSKPEGMGLMPDAN